MTEKTVLLVEDNADDEFFTCQGLNNCDVPLTLHVARDGAEALDMLFKVPGLQLNPDLILLDLNMPKLDGIAVLVRLRQENLTRLIPVVMFTSSAQPGDVMRAFEAGANSYVAKPLNTKRLLEMVGEMTRYWLCDNSLPAKGAC